MKKGSLSALTRLALLLPLLGVGLLTPGTSLATEGSTLTGQGRESPLRLMQDGAEGESDGLPRLLRVPAELGLGALGGVGLGVSGALLGALLTPPDSESPFPVLLGGALGYGVGVTLGVWGAGRLAGSQGSFLATTAGTAAGMLLGAGITSLFRLSSRRSTSCPCPCWGPSSAMSSRRTRGSRHRGPPAPRSPWAGASEGQG
jgi:hypothetical protein